MKSAEPAAANAGWRFRRGLAWGRKAWWVEILTILFGYLIYELVQGAAPKDHALALRNGQRVHDLQVWLHIDVDPGINRFVNDHHPLALITGYDYDILHYVMTTTVLLLVWWRRPLVPRTVALSAGRREHQRAPRFFGCCRSPPPRFVLPNQIVDTLVVNHIFGTVTPPDHPPPLVNVDAAMPSLHVGWSLWCAATIIGTTRIWFRWIAALYPVWTTFVVIGTGNHYLLDAVGGFDRARRRLGGDRRPAVRLVYRRPARPGRDGRIYGSSDRAAPGPRSPDLATGPAADPAAAARFGADQAP